MLTCQVQSFGSGMGALDTYVPNSSAMRWQLGWQCHSPGE